MNLARNILAVVVGIVLTSIIQGLLFNVAIDFYPELLPNLLDVEDTVFSTPFLITQIISAMIAAFCASLVALKIAYSHHKQVCIAIFAVFVVTALGTALFAPTTGYPLWILVPDFAAKALAIYLAYRLVGKPEDESSDGYIQGEGGYIEGELASPPLEEDKKNTGSKSGNSIWSIVVGIVIVAKLGLRIAKNGADSVLPIIIAVVVIGGIIYFVASSND